MVSGLSVDAVIERIADLQSTGDRWFPTGLFAAYRSNATLRYYRPDTNVFFTAITVFTLQQLRPHVSPTAQQRIEQIWQRAVRTYPLFRNKDGLLTYNFWPTRPSQHFSNGYLFRHFDHFRIPDDIDDTAMVYLTTSPTTDEVAWLQTKLGQHANLSQRMIRNTYGDYQTLRAYSTWFGKTMGIDFDACAMSNLLYCLFQYDRPRDQHVTDTLIYLRSVVETGRYRAEPFRCAPHYARPSLILYHLARLMAAFQPPELEPVRAQLIKDAQHLVERATNRLEQLVLTTTLLRLGQTDNPSVDLEHIEQAFGDFHFFIAGLLTAYEHPLLRRLADRPLVHMRWQCEAHCWALVAEYMVVERLSSS
ncbi:hypothetical protein DYU11_01765 [Fibrisoma montanum]|uniref:Uncharacterized protein n=1 Tax=Fibrisoma montanum TaxID=2305895 RepID=A0A418MI03_9BACT|nr:hypothetical protein [Fibrisoma montanum]RIV27068.1 hypothetical protein DYU11_01765 [Fibrisoma montanum]